MPTPLTLNPHPSNAPRLFICGCGPGELMAWVRPLLLELERQDRAWEISLVFWPRLFLSGREAETARRLPGVDRAFPPLQALGLLSGALTPGPGRKAPCLVLHMGGAASLSLGLGRRLRAQVLAYGEQAQPLSGGFFAQYSADAPDSGVKRGVRPLGNLLVDSVMDLRELRNNRVLEGGVTVGLLPGSRALQLRHYLPRIAPVAKAVLQRLPGVNFLIARSPLVSDNMLRRVLRSSGPDRLERRGNSVLLRTGSGLHIPLVSRERVLAESLVLVSTPGTNTGEAAALGIPHLVVAPFDPSLPLFTGLPGLIEGSPWPGRPLKRLFLRRLTGGVRYYAQANLRAGREIVPELQGPLDIGGVADRLIELLRDGRERERISRELAGIMGPAGAAQRLVQVLDRQFSLLYRSD